MKIFLYRALACMTALLHAGCTYTAVHWDEEQLRLGMLEFYRAQIMDNLIRASRGLPFLQVDLGNLTAAVQNKLAASVGIGQTLNDTSTRMTSVGGTLARGAVGVVSTATQMAMRPFTATLTPERDNNISVTENPTFGDAYGVYQDYCQFLNMKKPGGPLSLKQYPWWSIDVNAKPNSLQTSDLEHPPKPSDYVEGTLTKWGNQYYYIPTAYKQAYFDLCFLINSRPPVIGTPAAQQYQILKQLKSNNGILQEINSNTKFSPN